MIKITRVKPYSEIFAFYKIYIDDVYRGKIDVGETIEFDVENGTHAICAKLDWTRSNTLYVDVNDSIVELEVGSSVVGWKRFIALVYATILAHKALWLRVKGSMDVSSESIK